MTVYFKLYMREQPSIGMPLLYLYYTIFTVFVKYNSPLANYYIQLNLRLTPEVSLCRKKFFHFIILDFSNVYIISYFYIFVNVFISTSFDIFFDIISHVWYNKAIVGFFRQEGGGTHELSYIICCDYYGTHCWLLCVQMVR